MNYWKNQKIGAVFFILWGLLHVISGVMFVIKSFSGTIGEALANYDPSVPVAAKAPAVAREITAFLSFDLAWAGVLVIAVALLLQWRDKSGGFWISLIVAGMSDVGLVVFFIIPRHISVLTGLPGITLFVLATVFSILGLLRSRHMVVHQTQS